MVFFFKFKRLIYLLQILQVVVDSFIQQILIDNPGDTNDLRNTGVRCVHLKCNKCHLKFNDSVLRHNKDNGDIKFETM